MEKHIMGENGISYTLGEDGLYYPDLYLPEETEYPIGKYGMLRKSYLQEHRKGQTGGADERKAGSDGRTEDAGSDGVGWENE